MEAEPPEEWQQQVGEEEDKGKMSSMGLPFLTGISPAGYLSANRKKLGGTDHPVQVRTGVLLVDQVFLSGSDSPCRSSGQWEALPSGQDPAGEDGGAAPSQPPGSLSDGPGGR